MWAQDNPLDGEVVGRYRTARAGLATILSQAGLDPVGWQGRLERLKGMPSRVRIKKLAGWLLDAADESHTRDDAERYVRGILSPETSEARAGLLKGFVPLLPVPGAIG